MTVPLYLYIYLACLHWYICIHNLCLWAKLNLGNQLRQIVCVHIWLLSMHNRRGRIIGKFVTVPSFMIRSLKSVQTTTSVATKEFFLTPFSDKYYLDRAIY